MDIQIVTIIVMLASATISLILACSKNNKCQKEGERPFIWGYFQGYVSIFLAILNYIIIIGLTIVNKLDGELISLGIFVTVHAILGYLVLKRNRWAFLIKTVITMNLFMWVINGIYIHNRWYEMAAFEVPVEVISNKPENST